MKTRLLLLATALALAPSTQANIGSDEALAGAVLGAVAGGILGNNIGDGNTWRGAALGAGAGLILGSAASERGVRVSHGSEWDDGHRGRSYRSGESGLGGAIMGGVAGGIIGNNVGDGNTWRGVAIGAGAGYVIGSSYDNRWDRGSRHERHERRSRYDRCDTPERWDRRRDRCDTDVVIIRPDPCPPRFVPRPRETTIIRRDDCGRSVVIIEERRRRSYCDETIVIRR